MKKVINLLGNRLERLLLAIGTVILLSMVVGICIDVSCRYFLGFSIFVIDELAALLWVWVVYLVAAVVTRRERHLVADFISQKYSKKGKKVLYFATHFLMLTYSAVLCWGAIQNVVFHKALGTVAATTLAMPEWIRRQCVIIGFGLIAFYTLELLMNAMGSHRKASDVKPGRPESVKEG